MSAQTKPLILLDTNIWLDYYDPYRPKHDDAFALLGKACTQAYQLTYFAGSIKDVYYILSKTQKDLARKSEGILTEGSASAIREYSWGCIQHMQEAACALPLDMRTTWMAERMKNLCPDFEDALILAACELNQVKYFVTNDETLINKASVPTLTSANMLLRLN